MGIRHSALSWCNMRQQSLSTREKPTTYYYRLTPSYDYDWTDLHYASSHGNIRRIQEIMHKTGTVNLNKKDYYGKTPLYWAAYKGHRACMEELLKFGAEVNTHCRHGGTPLHAVVSVYPDCALILIKHGADVNCCDNWGVTPMYLAASNGQLDVIRYLLAAGAHLTFHNKRGDIAKGLRQQEDFCRELMELSQTPRSLQHFCRVAIRRHLGDRPIPKVQRLKLPMQLQDYITLERLEPT